jgi:hypothetical protein
MGLELVELTMALEQRFGIHLQAEDWERVAAGRQPFDVKAGEVCRMVEAKRRLIRRVLQRQPDGRTVLHYQPPGIDSVDDTEDPWPGVRDDIAEVVGAKPERVARDSWLVRDLGLSA